MLDEPTFGQDRRTAIELLRLLAALRDEGTRGAASPPTTASSPPPWPTARCGCQRPQGQRDVRLFTPLRPDPRAVLAAANPAAKLAAAAVLMAVLFVSVDAVTAASC